MKQQLVEHESGYEMNIWSFAGFALSQSVVYRRPARASFSAAEPALATWPQLKMRKVDEKSKKFSVFLSRSPPLCLCLSALAKRNEIFSWVASNTRPFEGGCPLMGWAILLSRHCQCSWVCQTHRNWNVAPASAPTAHGHGKVAEGGDTQSTHLTIIAGH